MGVFLGAYCWTSPRWTGTLLVNTGIAFFPLTIATIPLEAAMPPYLSANLPFPTAWIANRLHGARRGEGRLE